MRMTKYRRTGCCHDRSTVLERFCVVSVRAISNYDANYYVSGDSVYIQTFALSATFLKTSASNVINMVMLNYLSYLHASELAKYNKAVADWVSGPHLSDCCPLSLASSNSLASGSTVSLTPSQQLYTVLSIKAHGRAGYFIQVSCSFSRGIVYPNPRVICTCSSQNVRTWAWVCWYKTEDKMMILYIFIYYCDGLPHAPLVYKPYQCFGMHQSAGQTKVVYMYMGTYGTSNLNPQSCLSPSQSFPPTHSLGRTDKAY